MKTKAYLLGSIIAIATALPASAQIKPMTQIPFTAERLLPGQKSATPEIDVEKEYPLLKGRLAIDNRSALFKRPTTVLKSTPKVTPLQVNQNLTIWGNLLSNGSLQGIYSFNPTPTINFTELLAYSESYFNGGSALIGDNLHGIYFDARLAPQGIILVYYYAFDIYTWDFSIEPKMVQGYNLIAMETAYDPTNDKIFGEFYTADLKGMEWGEIDYTTLTRTTIGPAQRTYVALGVTNDGRAFGVADDGNLYQIDRTTGTETLKGSTGIRITNDKGIYYFQSGEIDPKTNEFYWAATNSEQVSTLYTVDLNDGHLTEVGQLNDINILGMTIPKPRAVEDAPESVTDVNLNFTNESRTGMVSFKAPSKTYGGAALAGNLKYTITANDEEIAKDQPMSSGATVNAPATVNKEGMYVFTITASNDKGQSPKVKVKKYIGYDVPKPVKDITFSIEEATREAKLTWTAPTEGLNRGYIGNLTYDVYRIKNSDTTLVANNITQTSFSEILPQAKLASYTYAICAVNTTQKSRLAKSNYKIFGDVFEPPYFDNFEDESSSRFYKIIDNNNDWSTWEWVNDRDKGKSFFYKFSKKNTGDDWLITPAFKLKGGKTYNVLFKASGRNSFYPERIEVKYGTSATAEGMTEEVMPTTEITSGEFEEFEKQFTPAADGEYYIGFHAVSEPDRYYLFLDDIGIEVAADKAAPAAVTDLKATPDPTGALKSTITFKAPDKTISGSSLANITKIEIKSGNRLVKDITAPALGSVQTVIDNDAVAGYNSYTVIAYNDKGNGMRNNTKVYVGVDVPTKPDPKITDNITSVKFNWEGVTGSHGGIMLADKLEYNIFNVSPRNEIGDKLATIPGTATEYTVTGLNTNDGEQAYAKWAMNAKTPTGTSEYGVTSIIVGKPYVLPYHNSFKDAGVEGKFVALESLDQSVSWSISERVSVDDDGGSLIFNPKKEGYSSIIPGKLSFRGASNPKLIFDYQGEAAAPGKLEILIRHKDGTFDPAVWTHDFTNEPNPGEWNNVVVNLPASIANEDYVLLCIKATSSGDMSQAPIYVDNINIADPLQKDADIELTVPDNLKKGQMANLKLKVTSRGLDKVENAKVRVSVNNKIVHESTISQAIGYAKSVDIPVTYRTTTLDQATSLNVKAEVIVQGDLYVDNNIANATIALEKANVAAPTDLKNTGNHKPNVELTWKAPASTQETVNDDFEEYEAWGLDFGKWTTVDADHGKAGYLTQKAKYNHQGEEFAFVNWKPSDIFKAGQGLDPHSGDKAAVAIYQVEGQNFVDADNWLISPELSGKEQTVRFWVNNYKGPNYGTETFEILTSSTSNATSDFQKIGDTYTQGTGTWTEISVKVPQGTRYFAIHHITLGAQAFIFMIDDATFEASSGASSFNIYRDNEFKINTTELTFIDNSADAGTSNHTYSVTAVYFDGSESDPITISVASLIDTLQADGQSSFTVYTLDGKLVLDKARSLKSLQKGVYIINGKKTTVIK